MERQDKNIWEQESARVTIQIDRVVMSSGLESPLDTIGGNYLQPNRLFKLNYTLNKLSFHG